MSRFIQLYKDCWEQFRSNPYGFPANILSVFKLLYWQGVLKHITAGFIGTHEGMRVLYDTKSDGSAFTYYRPYLEYPLFWFVHSYVKKKYVVFDVGANMGNYTMLAAKQGARVYAFEPNHEAATLCRINTLLNNFFSVVIEESAVSNVNGTATFHLQSIGRSGISSLVSASVGTRKVTVPTVTLDTYCRDNHVEQIDFLKVDVEGAEHLVFEGAKKLLTQKKIRCIAWEASDFYIERGSTTIIEKLNKLGYKTISMDPVHQIVRPWKKDFVAFSYLPSVRISKMLSSFRKEGVQL